MVVRGHKIEKVLRGSIGEEVGIISGDSLISINGSSIRDILDYIEWCENDQLEIEITKADGEAWIIEIEKESGEDLGLIFEEHLLDRERKCSNRCIFCFVDQLPPDMRQSLYHKDDDWRLSFLMGNYITLTNLSERDIERIIDNRISPLYVSVHTTNPELRAKMLNNKRSGELLNYLKRFSDAKIQVNCQIVLCPGWNDGSELDKTIEALWELRQCVQSVAVVPVGLTSHREKLQAIEPFIENTASTVIDQVLKWQTVCKNKDSTSFIYAADEFYILAKREFPTYDDYEDFPQIENGVGLVVRFQNEFKDALIKCHNIKSENNLVTVVTGVSAGPIIDILAQKVESKYGIKVNVVPIKNSLFGEGVTVAGLVTGQDILRSLKEMDLGEKVIIPRVMLRKGEDVFLDNLTLEELQRDLNIPISVVPVDGEAFLDALIERV